MWYLTSTRDPRIIYIVPQKEIIIGRSVDAQYCNFAVPDDPSISRRHASLAVADGILFLQDLGSKYGTFINNAMEKLESNIKQTINQDDVIKFGKMDCVWKAHYINFTTCTSTLKGENLQNLKVILGKLGGTLNSDWNELCAYLTMPAITLTIKVVLALVQGSYIVTTEFWSKCVEAVTNCIILPDPKNFIPQIVESTLNKENVSFSPNDCRKTLFAGKTVIFFSRRQLDMYKNVLIKGSATALLLSETKMTKSMLCNDNIIVIQYNLTSTSQETQMQRNQINDIVDYLKSKGKRVVADAEIGLAVLYCSLDKYCNPDFNFSSEVIKQTSDQMLKPTNILAHESEEPVPNICKQEKIVINESLNSKVESALNDLSGHNVSNSSKRKWDEEENDMSIINPNKKLLTESDKISSNEPNSTKRTYEDIDGDNSNPAKKISVRSTSKDKDFFNFSKSDSPPATVNDINRKLNLSKPLKRKQDVVENEDDNLFNFVEDIPKPTKISKDAASDNEKTNLFIEQNTLRETRNTRCDGNDKLDISSLRGVKLEELIKNNLKMDYNTAVKKEDITEIDGKLNDLDLGSTTIILRSDLIVKKEPIPLASENSKTTNFKKFKKVWPVKMQISIIPTTSVNSLQSNMSEKMGSLCEIK